MVRTEAGTEATVAAVATARLKPNTQVGKLELEAERQDLETVS